MPPPTWPLNWLNVPGFERSTFLPVDDLGGTLLEIAHAVTAAEAAEFVGLHGVSMAGELESWIAEHGSLAVGNFSETYEVVRSDNDET